MARPEVSYISDWDSFVERGHYGWLRPEKSLDESIEVIVPEGLSYSDHSGSLAQKSNSRKWKELFSDLEDETWTSVAGHHGTSAIVLLSSAITPEMREVWYALADYPLIDDEDYSALQDETQDETWGNSTESEFKRAIHKKLEDEDETLLDAYSEKQIRSLFEFMRMTANEEWSNQEGDTLYIDVERIVKRMSERNIRAALAALADGVSLT